MPVATIQSEKEKAKLVIADLMGEFKVENNTQQKVKSYIALGKLAGILSESDKLIIYQQMKTSQLWTQYNFGLEKYPNPVLFYEITNIELSKTLIIVMIKMLDKVPGPLYRELILHNIQRIVSNFTETAQNYFYYILLPSLYEIATHNVLKLELLLIINAYCGNKYKSLLLVNVFNHDTNIPNIALNYLGDKFTENKEPQNTTEKKFEKSDAIGSLGLFKHETSITTSSASDKSLELTSINIRSHKQVQ